MRRIFKNAKLYTGSTVLDGYTLVVQNGFISSISASPKQQVVDGQGTENSIDVLEYDCKGKSIAPAFIDLQIYGANGRLLNNERTPELLTETHRHNLQGGTTRYQITLSTHSEAVMHESIALVATALKAEEPGLLGLHLEGPFINPVKRGAHLTEYIQTPTLDLLKRLEQRAMSAVTMLTVAPEYLDDEMAAFLSDTGWAISAGHSDAAYDQAVKGFENGITACTHLYNAMSPLTSRAPGLTGAAFNHKTAMASIIADGVHCDFASLAIAKKIMGDRLYLITDAVTACPTGPYAFFQGDNCFVNAEGTLSGSALSMIQAVKNCVLYGGIPLDEALRMASTYPAKLIGRKDLGILKPGARADLLVFDDRLNLEEVFYEGEPV